MLLLTSKDLRARLQDYYAFLDNDFLSYLFNTSKKEEFFKEMLIPLKEAILLVDPITAFEFLRDIFIPEKRKIMEEFMSTELFEQVSNHPQQLERIQQRALEISKIYTHHAVQGVSFADLMLAGRVSTHRKTLLITGNKKHFPHFLFNTKGIICIINEKGATSRTFWVVEVSEKKYKRCLGQLQEIDQKYQRKIEEQYKNKTLNKTEDRTVDKILKN